jgi:hypothetical protein
VTGHDWLDYLTLATAVLSLVIAISAFIAGRTDRRRGLALGLNLGFSCDEYGRPLEPRVPTAFIAIANKAQRPIEVMGVGFVGARGQSTQVTTHALPKYLADGESILVRIDPATFVATYRLCGPFRETWVFDAEAKRYVGMAASAEGFKQWAADVDAMNAGQPEPVPWPISGGRKPARWILPKIRR